MNNNTSIDGKHSFYSKSTKVLRLSEDMKDFNIFHVDKIKKKKKQNNISNAFTRNETQEKILSDHIKSKKSKAKVGKGKKIYMKIRMHRFSICSNFRINLKKYKHAYKELNNTLCFLNQKKNDNLNMIHHNIHSKNAKGLDTFYSLPNSADSKIFVDDELNEKNEEYDKLVKVGKKRRRKKIKDMNNNLNNDFFNIRI